MPTALRAWLGAALVFGLVGIGACRSPAQSQDALASLGFPEPEPSARTLGVTAPGVYGHAPAPSVRPLHVTFRSPEAHGEGQSPIQVAFNQPMVTLGRARDQTEDPSRYPIRIEPAIVAHYRWVGGDLLKVTPARPFQNAQRYRVRLLPSLRSLTGRALEDPVEWVFETPRPKVTKTLVADAPPGKTLRIHPKAAFRVTVNLRTRPEALAAALSLSVNGQPWGVQVTRDPKSALELIVRPARPLPLSAKIVLTVAKGLQSEEGPLVGFDRFEHRAEVHHPLRVGLRCGTAAAAPGSRCWPMDLEEQGVSEEQGGLRLRFSEPVTRAQLLAHLRVTPPVPKLGERLSPVSETCSDEWTMIGHGKQCATEWKVRGDLRPNARHVVRVGAGLTDLWGQRLGTSQSLSLWTRDFPPGIHLPQGIVSVHAASRPWRFKATNVQEVHARLTAFTGPGLPRFLACMGRGVELYERCVERQGIDEHSFTSCTSKWEQQLEGCLGGNPAEEQSLRLGGPRNVTQDASIDLPPGLVAVQLSSPQVRNRDGVPVRFLQLSVKTDLGLHARITPYGITSWITSLETGRPIPGALVTAYDPKGQVLGTGQTDAQGFLQMGRASLHGGLRDEAPPVLLLEARKGRDVTYVIPGQASSRTWLCHHENPTYKNRIDAERWQGDRPVVVGHLATERGAYRPGDEVLLHGAVRRFRATKGAPVSGEEVVVSIEDMSGLPLGRARARTSDHGVFLTRLSLPKPGKLGFLFAILEHDKQRLTRIPFLVKEFRAPKFEAQVKLSPDSALSDGELNAAIRGRYLFGGPMGGGGYRLTVTHSIRTVTWKRWPDYRAGETGLYIGLDDEVWYRSEGALDDLGQKSIGLSQRNMAKKRLAWPGTQISEVEIRSAARRTVAARHEVNTLPGERLVAVRELPSRPHRLRYHLRVFDPQGRPHRAGRVEAKLLAMEKVPKGWEVRWSQTLWQRTLAVGPGGAALEVPWPRAYPKTVAYLLLSVTDTAGRETLTGDRCPIPQPEPDRSTREPPSPESRELFRITLDKKEYLPGETALVTITRKGDVGSASLFVERERIFFHQMLRFDRLGRATVRLPVLASYAGGVELRVVGVRAGLALPHKEGPLIESSKSLAVSEAPFRLKVSLRADRKSYRPGEKVTLSLQVKDGLDRPRSGEVVVTAVDESMLRLTGFEPRDPLYDLAHVPQEQVWSEDVRLFLAIRSLEVRHAILSLRYDVWSENEDTLAALVGHTVGSEAEDCLGSLGGLPGPSTGRHPSKAARLRRDFRPTVLHTSIHANASGQASLSFTLPDSVTSYRVMAFAVDRDRSSGLGSTSIQVEQPFLALPALPRHLREGDSAQVGLVLHSQGAGSGPTRITAHVRGDALTLDGARSKTLHLVEGRSAAVRFGLRALRKGVAYLTFQAERGGHQDRLEFPLEVDPAILPETTSVSGETRRAVRHELEPPSGLRMDHGGLELTLSSTVLQGAKEDLDLLLEYPYGCLEQQTSRLLALLAQAALGDRIAPGASRRPEPAIRAGLRRIFSMQTRDGGFGFWPSQTRSSPWATAHALVVLHRVKRAGFVVRDIVPDFAVVAALYYLKSEADSSSRHGQHGFGYEAYLRYALAVHGRDQTKPALALYKARRHQPLFARALLLATLALQKSTTATVGARARLEQEIGDSLRVEATTARVEEGLGAGYQALFHSDDRTTAMVLHALLLSRPDHPLAGRLARYLVEGRKQARSRNTQEAAWALMALWDYADLRERRTPDFEAGIWLGSRELARFRFEGASPKPHVRRFPMDALAKAMGDRSRHLTLAKRGLGTLYYLARLSYARSALPSRPRDQGITVEKEVQVLDRAGRPLVRPRPARLGDTLLCTIRVTSAEPRRYVVVDDPLPAGLESIDTTLAVASQQDAATLSSFETSRYDHRELRDDRALFFRELAPPGTLTFRYLARVTTPGSFVAPPTRAEEMYNPEVFGHTAAHRITYADNAGR